MQVYSRLLRFFSNQIVFFPWRQCTQVWPLSKPKNDFSKFKLISNSRHLSKHWTKVWQGALWGHWIHWSHLKTISWTHEVFTKCHIHCLLVSWWNIIQSKWHDYLNKCSPIYDEGNFVLVFWGDCYLMIPQKVIQKRIDFMSYHQV